jgi:hypothetical protein
MVRKQLHPKIPRRRHPKVRRQRQNVRVQHEVREPEFLNLTTVVDDEKVTDGKVD